jgi:small-conductance mechanosensitive channel
MDKIQDYIPDKYEQLGVFLFIVMLTILFGWLARRGFARFICSRTEDMNSDPTNYKFLGNALTTIIYTIGFIFAIREYPPLKSVAGSLLTGAGILAAIVGFASQQAFSNIVSGIFIVIFKPFRVNDRLKIKEIYSGVVEDITLRHTIIRDFENRRIVVPNTVIASEILVNADYDDQKICRFMEIGISFDSDIGKAKHIIADEIANHPYYIDPRSEEEIEQGKPLVEVRVIRFTDYAMILRGWAWAKDNSLSFEMYCDLLESIKKRFDTEGVEIPYPHFVVKSTDIN